MISTHQSVGYAVPVDDARRLHRHATTTVIGINVTNQDLGYVADVIDAVGGRVEVHVGGPAQALTAWSLGATGFLSSEANLAPELCMTVVDAYRTGDAAALARPSASCCGSTGRSTRRAAFGRPKPYSTGWVCRGSAAQAAASDRRAAVDELMVLVRALGVLES